MDNHSKLYVILTTLCVFVGVWLGEIAAEYSIRKIDLLACGDLCTVDWEGEE